MALLIQISIGPKADSTAAAALSTASASATSASQISPRPPAASTSRNAPSSPALPRASNPIQAPRLANATAVARPTPADAPVIITTSGRGDESAAESSSRTIMLLGLQD